MGCLSAHTVTMCSHDLTCLNQPCARAGLYVAWHCHVQPAGHTPLHMRFGRYDAHHNLCCSEASPPCLFPHFPFLSGCHIQTDGESACLIFGPLILACSHPINIVVVVGKAVGEWNETSPLAASTAVLDAEVPCACMVCICRWFLATRAACGGWTPSVHKM